MKRLLAASIIAAAFASGTAFAQVGPYAGVSAGMAKYSADCTGISCDKSDFGFKLFGGYMFTPFFGAEVQYADYGKMTASDPAEPGLSGDLSASGFGAFLVGQYPIENFRVFGKLGFAYVDTEISLLGVSISDSKTNFAWGIGAAYMINKNLGVRAEYEQTKYKLEALGEELKDNIGMWSIGVQYSF